MSQKTQKTNQIEITRNSQQIQSKVEVKGVGGRPKGYPKSGGRKKGTPNKNRLKIQDELERFNFNVVEEAIKLFQENDDINVKLKIIDLLSRHSLPTPKPVDLETGSSDQVIEIKYEKFEKDIN